MSQSLARLHVHLIFSTKHRERLITDAVRDSLHAYMATVLQNLGCAPMLINSVEDHVHILFELARTVSVSQAVEDVKKSSSKWIKTQGNELAGFAWQGGTGRLPSANPMSQQSAITSPDNANIIGSKRSRKNTGRFWKNTASRLMNGMCGIERRVGPPFQGFELFGGLVPRALPWAVTGRAVGAQIERNPPPKGQAKKAQGNALDMAWKMNKALKGRSRTPNANIRPHE